MSAKKVSESSQIFAELLAINEQLPEGFCDCQYPNEQVLSSYRMVDILDASRSFVDPVIFALEYHVRGSRIFFCASRKHFPHYFMRIRADKPQYTTWHEILAERSTHLYFDLEFYTKHNPGANGLKIIENFKLKLVELLTDPGGCFAKEYGDLPSDRITFVEFDASIESKFSRHLIVPIENFAFPNPKDVGCYVAKLCKELGESFDFLNKEGTKRASLVDLSVYQIGQNLRMLGSPKFGRTNTLIYVNPLQSHEFRFHDNCGLCAEMLLNTLATASCQATKEPYMLIENFEPVDLQHLCELVTSDDHSPQIQLRSLTVSVLDVCRSIVALKTDIMVFQVASNLVEKLNDGNTFFDTTVFTYWMSVISAMEKVLVASSLRGQNVPTLQFELGKLTLILSKTDDLHYIKKNTMNSAPEEEVEKDCSTTENQVNDKKSRHNLSLLLRFLQKVQSDVKQKHQLDYASVNDTFTQYLHHVPAEMKTNFPDSIDELNVMHLDGVIKFLVDFEKNIRAARIAKVATKNAEISEKLRKRNEEEVEFRELLQETLKNVEDERVKANLQLIIQHSSALKFTKCGLEN